MSKYKFIFFDLDRTLWDFDTNSATTLIEAIDFFKLGNVVSDKRKWVELYSKHNAAVWILHEQKKISKYDLRRERFRLLLEEFKVSDTSLLNDLNAYYIANSPSKSALMPGVKNVLEYLSLKYQLFIVSNGFFEVQQRKLMASGIDKYFSKVFTSDLINVAKPDKRIFQYALKSCNAKKEKSLFVGDNLINDVQGPQKFGIDQVWYNYNGVESTCEATYRIGNLIELKEFL
jgi:putative hydrolase of the HAD superfamily